MILISQASSEHSICFAVPTSQIDKTKEAVKKVFASELQHSQIERIQVLAPCSILAMVGDNMVEKSGVAGRFFSALGNAGVSVRAIAQGSSERNISVVIDQSESTRALRATHSAFFLSDYTLSIGLIGPGLIGKEFLKQLAERQNLLKKEFKLDVRVRAIINSKQMLLESKAININHWENEWKQKSTDIDFTDFTSHIQSDGIPHSVLIDCSSSEDIVKNYPMWLK